MGLSKKEKKELKRDIEELRETKVTRQTYKEPLREGAEIIEEFFDPKEGLKTSRRSFIKYAGAAVAGGLLGAVGGYYLGPRPEVVKEVEKIVTVSGAGPSAAVFEPWAYPTAPFPLATVGFGFFDDWTAASQYEQAFRDVITNSGGWEKFKSICEGQHVFIKPVAMGNVPKIPAATEPEGGWVGEQLSPLTIRAVCKVVNEAGAEKITCWSNGSCRTPQPHAMRVLGFLDATSDLPYVTWLDGEGPSDNPTPLFKFTPPNPICSTVYYWPEPPAKEADTIISIAVAKTHLMARCTLGLKNLDVSGSRRSVYTGALKEGMEYYDVRKTLWEDVLPDEETATANLQAHGTHGVYALHFKSYVDWLNKFGGKEPYDLPLRFASFHAECADNDAAVFSQTNVKNWFNLIEFTKGIAGSGPGLGATSWTVDYKALTPNQKYFLVGGYDFVATDAVGAMCIGYSPFEIENEHSDIRQLQWTAMHGVGTHRLSEISVVGVDDLLRVNANSERAQYSDARAMSGPGGFFYYPPEYRVTDYLDMRSTYLSTIEEEIAKGALPAAMAAAPMPY